MKGKGVTDVGCGLSAMHLRRRMVRVTPGAIAKWDTRESQKVQQGATKLCESHGKTPTAHARRRVAVRARR